MPASGSAILPIPRQSSVMKHLPASRVLFHSLAHDEPLVRLDAFLGQLALAVRQDDFQIHALLLAQAEVRHRFLARTVAVADADLPRAEQGSLLSQLAGDVKVNQGAD